MNRRATLKTLIAATGTMAVLPSWATNWSPSSIDNADGVFNSKEINLLSQIADTIIPRGEAVGAKDVGVHKYLQKLISDCYEVKVQDNVKNQMAALSKKAMKFHKLDFGDCSQQDRQSMLVVLADGNEDESSFFNLMKMQTIRGYNTSQEVMVNHLGYVMAPGFYDGCADV